MPAIKHAIHVQAPQRYRTKGRVAGIRAAAMAALAQAQLPQPAEVSIRLSDDAELRALNLQFRVVDKTTDVLSFGGEGFEDGRPTSRQPSAGPTYLGDIVISMDRCTAQAAEFGHTPDAELALLVIHGVLHVCGYDHMSRARKKAMWQAQDRAFALLGRPNPLKPGQFHD